MADRIILFGGTFDPVHVGHTAVVEHAAQSLDAGEVVFIPARRSPHKVDPPLADAEHRINMLHLATNDLPGFGVSRCEIDRPAPSYTYDTVMQFRVARPGARLTWLIGADMVGSLPSWYRIGELMQICDISVMSRGGVDAPNFDAVAASLGKEAGRKLREAAIVTPLIPVSSTEVRARLATGQDVSGMLHPGVLAYIYEHGLYSTGR